MPAPPPFPGAIPPPLGVVPNVTNPVNGQTSAVVGATVVMIVVVSALLLLLGMCGIALNLLKYGMGIHGWDVTPNDFSEFIRHNNYHQIMYGPSIFFAKAAILLQFADIFIGSKARNIRWWIIWGLICFNLALSTSILFIIIFECVPRKKIWQPDIPGTCIKQQKMFVGTSVINVIDDFAILTLPLFWISKLQIDRKRKYAVASIFAAGLFACITSIMRLVVGIATLNSMDLTYLVLPVALWAMAEVAAALLVACLPVMPRLFRRSIDKPTKGSSKYNSGSQSRVNKSQDRYYEMSDDEVQLHGLPSTHLSVDTQTQVRGGVQSNHSSKHDHDIHTNPMGKSGSEIYRSISIDQTTSSL
ncbi:MAG: hypothetical protein M1820_003647 [Bogoriella megaspora]|nr:MAG: hypothetical protein M1820_003647 [Bogoriella megaspora]